MFCLLVMQNKLSRQETIFRIIHTEIIDECNLPHSLSSNILRDAALCFNLPGPPLLFTPTVCFVYEQLHSLKRWNHVTSFTELIHWFSKSSLDIAEPFKPTGMLQSLKVRTRQRQRKNKEHPRCPCVLWGVIEALTLGKPGRRLSYIKIWVCLPKLITHDSTFDF